MSEYLSKKAVLEWLESEMSINKDHPDDIDIHWTLNRVSKKILSGAFDVDESEGTWKATAEVLGRENAQMNSEIQRLRAALEQARRNLLANAPKTALGHIEEALSTATESTGQKDADDLIGDRIDERCPKCGADLLANKVGDKWCSLVGCDYSINAPEGDGNDA